MFYKLSLKSRRFQVPENAFAAAAITNMPSSSSIPNDVLAVLIEKLEKKIDECFIRMEKKIDEGFIRMENVIRLNRIENEHQVSPTIETALNLGGDQGSISNTRHVRSGRIARWYNQYKGSFLRVVKKFFDYEKDTKVRKILR